MKTLRLSVFGVPAHPVFNDVPGTLLTTASLCDAIYLWRGDETWAWAGYRMLQIGNASGWLAAGLGILDLLRLPRQADVRRLGLAHGSATISSLLIFAACQRQRRRYPQSVRFGQAAALAVANLVLNTGAAFGARLVHEHRVRTGEHERLPFGLHVEDVEW